MPSYSLTLLPFAELTPAGLIGPVFAAVDSVAGVGLVTAFIAGFVSFLSPCVLPIVPGYLSAVSGCRSMSSTMRAGRRSSRPA